MSSTRRRSGSAHARFSSLLAGLAGGVAVLASGAGCSSSDPAIPSSLPDARSAGTGGDGGGGALPDAAAAPDAAAPDNLAATLEPYRVAGGMPAIGGAVWRGGTLVALGASGVRKAGDPTPVTVDDQWHLGSDTKAMTATLIALYVDRGKIHFDDTIATLFPTEKVDPSYAQVTLLQLLQHRGGAPATMPPDIWAKMWSDGSAPGARLTAVRALLGRPTAQAPGTFAYANAGYMIAGAALEHATGQTWEALIAQDLWTPLHMTGCGFGAPGTASLVDQPWGHAEKNGQADPVPPGPGGDNPPSLGPAGTVHCSLRDWGHFLALHVAGARGESTIVSAASMARLQTPPVGGDYAGGWIVTSRPWAGGTAITHTGSNTLWYATAWLAPAKNLVMAVVTNRASPAAAKSVDDAFGALIQTYGK